MTGEIKKLPKPLAIVRKFSKQSTEPPAAASIGDQVLEIIDVVKYKIVFSQRPEPISEEVQV